MKNEIQLRAKCSSHSYTLIIYNMLLIAILCIAIFS